LVECGLDGYWSEGDGEQRVSVYGMEWFEQFDGESRAWDRDGWFEGLDGELREAGGIHGEERTFGSSGGGGRGYVYDATDVQLVTRDGTYDRGSDDTAAGGNGDSLCVSGMERPGRPEPCGDGASDGDDLYGDVCDAAWGDGCGESCWSWDVELESRGGGG
jgi:hypothetical protein